MGLLDDMTGFVIRVIAVLTAIVFHEYAHGWMADSQGDPTPRSSGRLTVNPLAHLDPIGTLMLLFFRFGWAKPVPVNPAYFRDRRRGMLWVAAAGPAANLVTAFVAMGLYQVVRDNRSLILLTSLLESIILFNIWFALFNLLPVPPLDGSRIFRQYLRGAAARAYWQYERYGMIVMVLLVASGIVGAVLGPVAGWIITLMYTMTRFLH